MSPAERSAASGSGPSAPSGALAASSMTAVGGPTRILLVEDEENFRDPLAYGLRRDGFEVVEAEDGQRAVEIFEDTGAIAFARSYAADLTARAKETLGAVDLDEGCRALFLDMADFFIERLS